MARTAGRMAWLFGEPGWGVEAHPDAKSRQRARAEAWSGAKSFRQRRFLHGSGFLAVSGGIGKAAGGAYRQLPEHSRPAESRRRIPTGFHQPAQGCEQRATLGKPVSLPSSTRKGLYPSPAHKPAAGPHDTTLLGLVAPRAEHPGWLAARNPGLEDTIPLGWGRRWKAPIRFPLAIYHSLCLTRP